MNFKMNHIDIVFKNNKIIFSIEDDEVGSKSYNCEIFQNKDNVNKENFDDMYKILEKEIKRMTKGFIFRPTLQMDVRYIEDSKFSEIHKQFFTELGLCLPVRNFELISH